MKKGSEFRKADHAIEKLFLDRWSPRAFTGEAISQEELCRLFEAARWAPSSYNNQSWRFLYAHRDTPLWPLFLDLLVDANKAWAKNAAVLIVVASKTTFDHNETPARTHTFDTGAAWENMALQATAQGLAAHGMQGFDYDKARAGLGIPELYSVEAMLAIGKASKVEDLPEEIQKRETPNDRRKISEIAFEGKFPA